MSDTLHTTVDGFEFGGTWHKFHVPLPIAVDPDVDFTFRALSHEPFAFGTGKTPEAAIASLQVHLGKQYDFARWAAEMID